MIKNRLINFFSKKEITAPIRNKMMMNWSNEKNFYNQRKTKEKLRLKEEAKMTKEFNKVDKEIKIEILPKKKPNVK